MMHAYLWWLSNGGSELTLDMGTDHGVVLRLPPLSFRSPVSIPREADAAEVGPDDDLDADWDDEDYDEIVEEADE